MDTTSLSLPPQDAPLSRPATVGSAVDVPAVEPGPRWPGETPEYRAARNALTDAEHHLTRTVERVAQLRRELPPGGAVPEDYVFAEGPRDLAEEGGSRPVRMSELFGEHPTLLLYSFMFGVAGIPCRMCTSLVDGFDGAAADLERRAGFAVVATAPLADLRSYGAERRWRNVRLISDEDAAYSRAYGGMGPGGELHTRMNVFSRRDGSIRHFYATEKPPSGDGQDNRHLDQLWALWGALDLTPEGRGGDWRPDRPPRR